MVPADAVGARRLQKCHRANPEPSKERIRRTKIFFCSQRRMTLSGVIDLDEE